MPKNLRRSSFGFAPIIVLAIVAILATAAFGYFRFLQSGNDGSSAVCTLEAKICPDGSAVGRIPPQCEFAPCPGSTAITSTPSVTCQTCQIKTSNEILDSDLKSLDNFDSSISSGLNSVDSGLSDKGDNLAE